MAATIARLIAFPSRTNRYVTRLGHRWSEGQANTRRTFTTCLVNADGSGYIQVRRDGKLLHLFRFEPESGPLEIKEH